MPRLNSSKTCCSLMKATTSPSVSSALNVCTIAAPEREHYWIKGSWGCIVIRTATYCKMRTVSLASGNNNIIRVPRDPAGADNNIPSSCKT